MPGTTASTNCAGQPWVKPGDDRARYAYPGPKVNGLGVKVGKIAPPRRSEYARTHRDFAHADHTEGLDGVGIIARGGGASACAGNAILPTLRRLGCSDLTGS